MSPETSYGYALIDFASTTLRRPLDPWQEFLAIHAGELLADGRPRFREVMVLVARQNGKTEFTVILTLFWLFVEFAAIVLGISSKLEYAKESWEKALRLAKASPDLRKEFGGERRSNGEVEWWMWVPEDLLTPGEDDKCRYKIAAANDDAGRSLTIHRLILDELRRLFDWTVYNASLPTISAVPDAQVFMISNQGDFRSVVLRSLRKSALEFLRHQHDDNRMLGWSAPRGAYDAALERLLPAGNPRFGLFEWSSPPGAAVDDLDALARANPNLGHRLAHADLEAQAARIARLVAEGGDPEAVAGWRIEVMCQEVDQVDPAISPAAWEACAGAGGLDDLRDRVACCLDISMDQRHATLVAAARRDDGVVVLDVVKAWEGDDVAAQVERDLPALMQRVKARTLVWFPGGPAASLAARLSRRRQRPGVVRWPTPGLSLEELSGDALAACMGLESLVRARQVVHSSDPLLDKHVLQADRLYVGERWRFTRIRGGQCDAAYAGAGAAHQALITQPKASLYATKPTETQPEDGGQ